jgi:hypothetical protein
MRVQILMYYRHIEYAVLMGEYTTMSTHSLSEHHSTDVSHDIASSEKWCQSLGKKVQDFSVVKQNSNMRISK